MDSSLGKSRGSCHFQTPSHFKTHFDTLSAKEGDLRHLQYNGGAPMTEISVKRVFR